MKDDKISLKRHIAANWRGIKLLNKIFPSFLPLSAIAALLTTLQPLLVVVFSANLIDELAGGRDIGRLAMWAALAVGVTFAVSVISAAINRRLNVQLFETSTMRPTILRNERFADLDYEYAERAEVSELLSDIDGKENWAGLGLTRTLRTTQRFFAALFGIIAPLIFLIGMLAAEITLIPLLIAPIVPVVVRVLFVKRNIAAQQSLHKAMPKANALYGYLMFEYIQPDFGAKDARIFNQKASVMDALERLNFGKFRRMLVDGMAVSGSVTDMLSAVIAAAAYVFVGLKALAGVFTMGQVTQYVGMTRQFTNSVASLAYVLSTWAENTPSLLRLYEYLDIPDTKRTGDLHADRSGAYELEFKNVSFKYPNAADYALKDLNLKIVAGRKMAVVGVNGSGKTTMIKLLCRLYDPTEGEITLNGIDIKRYEYGEYMRLFAAVFQDFKLTGFSIAENVAAAAEYDEKRVTGLLSMVGFGDKHPITTTLYREFDEEHGVVASGGEAQKIALARALYRDSPIIVLDEPTAALDPIAESEIYSKFDSLVGERTAIYISHRLSSCRFCDDIAVFDKGRLVQRGGHDALVADEKGKYNELWTAQAQYYQG